MSKRFMFLSILIVALMLSACTKEKIEQEPVEETDLSLYSGPLPDVNVYSGSMPAAIVAGNSCWGKAGKPCQVTFQDPLPLLENTVNVSGNIGEDLLIVLSASDIERQKHLLDTEDVRLEVTQFHKGEQEKVDVDGLSFKSPNEPGLYRYLATLTWEGETKGQANFAFSFSFKE